MLRLASDSFSTFRVHRSLRKKPASSQRVGDWRVLAEEIYFFFLAGVFAAGFLEPVLALSIS
ncbi:MAG: hypothetical protein ACREIQ_05315, partial [Nitrospiria bacterium]